MGGSYVARIYENFSEFVACNFKVRIDDDGTVTVDGNQVGPSYGLHLFGMEGKYTKDEALRDFVHSQPMKDYAKRNYWTIWKLERRIV